MHFASSDRLGAQAQPEQGFRFEVWAPYARRVELHLLNPLDQILPMNTRERGYWTIEVAQARAGTRYFYRLDGLERPDPASRLQPLGVHGPSEVTDALPPLAPEDWHGLRLDQYVVYELHVGTFTPAGTFDAVTGRLDELRELGVTALELMPVAEFPGQRNWGYDGVFPFAAHHTYGGPQGLRRLVDACHERGLAAVLDVVYNHLGPEGNYLADFGPYFSNDCHTPWGAALNLDGPGSDEVRRFLVENSLYWTVDMGFDALRLDALHALVDRSPQPFLAELAAEVHAAARARGRLVHLFAESDSNDSRMLLPPEQGGFSLDAHWNDDFHHSLHSLLTGESWGRYRDYGSTAHLAQSYEEGFVYSGQYSRFFGRRQGSSARALAPGTLVAYSQNHDQVGNRPGGERLAQLVDFEAAKLAAAAVLLSPFLPLLFMGEEYAEPAPFLYFTSHGDPNLPEMVRRGRLGLFGDLPSVDMPDPQEEETYLRSKLDWSRRAEGRHATLLAFYRKLLQLRNEIPPVRAFDPSRAETAFSEEEKIITLRRRAEGEDFFLALHFAPRPSGRAVILPPGAWDKELDSAEERWLGPGSAVPWVVGSSADHHLHLPPHSAVLFRGRPGPGAESY